MLGVIDELAVGNDLVVKSLGSVQLLFHDPRLGADGLAAHLGDLGLGVVQPLLGPLDGVVVVLGLVSDPSIKIKKIYFRFIGSDISIKSLKT